MVLFHFLLYIHHVSFAYKLFAVYFKPSQLINGSYLNMSIPGVKCIYLSYRLADVSARTLSSVHAQMVKPGCDDVPVWGGGGACQHYRLSELPATGATGSCKPARASSISPLVYTLST